MGKVTQQTGDYELLVGEIGRLLENARNHIASAVNTALVETYWHIGRYIVEYEQKGNTRAEYGSDLLNRLSKDLTLKYGKGFGKNNLFYIRKLYICFPKSRTLSRFLSWGHYYEILKADDPLEISFYTKECEKERWSVRELKRQIASLYYERSGLSQNREASARLATINARFNAELAQQIAGTLPTGHIYQFGFPSAILLSAGLPNLPIEMAASRLNNKAMQTNHPFDLSEIQNLVMAMQYPLAVFRSATRIGSYVVMTEIRHKGENFVVAIQTNRKKGAIEINDIRSLYPKNTVAIADWIMDGLLDYADKKRMVEWLSEQRSNSAEVRKLFNHATKIVQTEHKSKSGTTQRS